MDSKSSTSRSTLLIKGASILTMDPDLGDLEAGDIFIEDGKIADVAHSIEAPHAEIIDARDMIAIPGFVDTHRHLWEGLLRNALPDGTLSDYFSVVNERFGPAYEPKDVYYGTLLSALGAVNAGVTTVLDWAHIQNSPEHTDASIAALRDSGIRAVFAFGTPTADRGHKYPGDILRLRREVFSSDDQLLTLALATASPEYAPDEVVKAQWRIAREADARITVHAGIAGICRAGEIGRFGHEGMLGPDVTLVHCATLSETEWKILADTGTTVSISTPIELQMGHGQPPIQQAIDASLAPSLSVDVETSAPGDFFTQMRTTLAVQRGMAFARAHSGSEQPALLGVRDVLGYATVAGAAANGLSHKIGSISIGKQADLVLLKIGVSVMPVNDLAGAVVLGMDVSNVDTVLVGGKMLKRNGTLIGVDLDRLGTHVYEARDRVFRNADVCCFHPHGHLASH